MIYIVDTIRWSSVPYLTLTRRIRKKLQMFKGEENLHALYSGQFFFVSTEITEDVEERAKGAGKIHTLTLLSSTQSVSLVISEETKCEE